MNLRGEGGAQEMNQEDAHVDEDGHVQVEEGCDQVKLTREDANHRQCVDGNDAGEVGGQQVPTK